STWAPSSSRRRAEASQAVPPGPEAIGAAGARVMKMLLRGRFRTGEILGGAAFIRLSGGPDLGRSRDQGVRGRRPAGPDVGVRRAGAMAGWGAMTQKSIETLLDAARLAGLETTEGGRTLAKVSRPDAKVTSYRSALAASDGEGP